MLIGSHILSGNVLETRALDELLPDWKEDAALYRTPATRDRFYFLTQRRSVRLPTPPQMRNRGKGNQIVSLRQVRAN
jgi:electron-transferring-flavoprotein dehydrogenase